MTGDRLVSLPLLVHPGNGAKGSRPTRTFAALNRLISLTLALRNGVGDGWGCLGAESLISFVISSGPLSMPTPLSGAI